jgi:hypothetical protein
MLVAPAVLVVLRDAASAALFQRDVKRLCRVPTTALVIVSLADQVC